MATEGNMAGGADWGEWRRGGVLAWRLDKADAALPAIGETIRVDADPTTYGSGGAWYEVQRLRRLTPALFGARRLLDCLPCHMGPVVSRILLGGKVQDVRRALHSETLGSERTALWRVDATAELRSFALETLALADDTHRRLSERVGAGVLPPIPQLAEVRRLWRDQGHLDTLEDAALRAGVPWLLDVNPAEAAWEAVQFVQPWLAWAAGIEWTASDPRLDSLNARLEQVFYDRGAPRTVPEARPCPAAAMPTRARARRAGGANIISHRPHLKT